MAKLDVLRSSVKEATKEELEQLLIGAVAVCVYDLDVLEEAIEIADKCTLGKELKAFGKWIDDIMKGQLQEDVKDN